MATQYSNSTLTITSVGAPDPFVNQTRGRFYLTFTTGNRIEIWSSRSLVDIEKAGSRHVVWKPPLGTDHSADLWAPELHAIRDRWYIYYAAAHPVHGNKSHRMYVLGGPPASADPCQGQWEFLGRISGMPEQLAIDGTVFELHGQPYLGYSGWPLDNQGDSDLIQQLFIVGMEDPTSAGYGPMMICQPEEKWEFTRDANGGHGINEGPQFLASPDGEWKGLVYSCAGSWTREYKMATLQFMRGNPLDASSWRKGAKPLIETKPGAAGPFGPGHGSFLQLRGEVVIVYHATDQPTDGWDNRRARVQRVAFTGQGPYMSKSPDAAGKKGGLGERFKAKVKTELGMKKIQDDQGEESLKALLDGQKMDDDGVNGTNGANTRFSWGS
ncbi:glycoside hydrolase family 43 protein [Xylariaceae sp. FL0016]|nr:glycoside hydrolase family 43 protein [Xylariaceae sp. FL0016]